VKFVEFENKLKTKTTKVKQKYYSKEMLLEENEKAFSINSTKDTEDLAKNCLKREKRKSARLLWNKARIKENRFSNRKLDRFRAQRRALGELIEETVYRMASEIKDLPATIVIAYLEKSTQLFEDHKKFGFFGVNACLKECVNDPGYAKLAKLLLQVGFRHELLHDLSKTKTIDMYFERREISESASILFDLMRNNDVDLKTLSAFTEKYLESTDLLREVEWINEFKKNHANYQGFGPDDVVVEPKPEQRDFVPEYIWKAMIEHALVDFESGEGLLDVLGLAKYKGTTEITPEFKKEFKKAWYERQAN